MMRIFIDKVSRRIRYLSYSFKSHLLLDVTIYTTVTIPTYPQNLDQSWIPGAGL
jgi:hypothetical protein